jgi:ribose transport system permease protein
MTSLASTLSSRSLSLTSSDRVFFILSRFTALFLLVLALSIVSPYFLTWNNISNILRQASMQFLMSAGLTIVVLTGGIDLSVGAVIGLSACLGASFIASGDLAFGIAAALAVGLACGLTNGIVVSYLRIPSFIATYGMLWIAFGLGYVFMKGEVIYGFDPSFRFIGSGFIGPIPALLVVALVVLLILHIVLQKTPFGRAIYAIGGNETAARLSGMPVQRRLMYIYGLSGLLSAVAGLVAIARTNAADAGLGEELLLPAIAAVSLGGTSLLGGVGGIVGTAVGALILSLIINGMNLLGVTTYWQAFVMGAIIIVCVVSDELVRRSSLASGR